MTLPVTPFVCESIDLKAAWELYYSLADRRHKAGLTRDELDTIVAAALGETIPAKVWDDPANDYYGYARRCYLTDWRPVSGDTP